MSTSQPDAILTRCHSILRSPGFIFLVAVAIRILALAIVPHLPTGPDSPIWKIMGGEMVNVASSIADHSGFSSPFGVPTGPTAWVPPVYPYLLAGIFRIAGTRSPAAWYSIMLLQVLFSALTCVPVYQLARRASGQRLAMLSAWTWALFPYAVVIPVLFIWETTMSALILTVAVLLSLDLPNRRPWIIVCSGLTWGLAALTNTALLAVMPFALLWPFRRRALRQVIAPAAAVVAIAVVVLTPWLIRNFRTFHTLMPVRSNFAEQLWLGNHAGGIGRVGYGMYPLENSQELQRYRELGEVGYEQHRLKDAVRFIAHHPGQFTRWILYRAAYWWFGIGESAPIFILYLLLGALSIPGGVLLWRTKSLEARLLVITVFVFPLVYYFTDVYARYRYPVEPFMIILSSYVVIVVVDHLQQWKESPRSR